MWSASAGRSLVFVLFAAFSGFGPACGEEVPWPVEPSSVGPIALPPGQAVGDPSFPLGPADATRFSAVAQMWSGLTCHGAFVVPSAVDLAADGPAYVLTAGHCALGINGRPNEVVLDEWVPPDSITLGLFADPHVSAVRPGAVRAVFGTLKGADLALIELAQTRVQLRRMGVIPFVLADEPSADDEEIAIPIHVEIGGLLSTCHFERRVPFLLEAPYHFFDVEANRCLDVSYGASGAPVLSLTTGKVVSIISTGVVAAARAGEPCVLNAPCEAAPPGVRFEPGTNYAVPVAGLAACFDRAGRFDIGAAACPLDRGNQMQPTDVDYRQPGAAGGSVAFDLTLVTEGLTHYRYLVAPVGTDDCRDVARYGPVVSAASAPSIHATVPGEPGQHLVCLQAGSGPDPAAGGWQDARQPTMVVATVDTPSTP
jgi:hypothetical protein